jgi:hypothetical protein
MGQGANPDSIRMKRYRQLIALGLGLACANATADPLPSFQLVRSNEDWSGLRDAPERAPRFKYIALSSDGRTYLSLGGEFRERFDAFDAPRFGIGRPADDYLLQRVLVRADLHFNDRVRVFAQLGREDSIGKKGPLSPSDTDRGDVQNLFVDIVPDHARHLTLRLGRQELMFNPTQRFVSVREGPNVRQSFDGVRATWHSNTTTLDLFATRPVLYRIDSFDDRPDNSQAFFGAYVSRKFGATSTLGAYYFGLLREDVQFGAERGDERRQSLGVRMAGEASGLDYDLEAVSQWGRFADRDIRAWAVGAIVGHTSRRAWSPRYALELDMGSGDHGRADTLSTFNPLFPKGAYFDETGLFSWANSIVVRPSLTLQPSTALSLRASIVARWRQDTQDAVYLQPYIPLTQTRNNRARNVGQAYELDATWHVGRSLTFLAEVAHLNAGAAITRAHGTDVDFAMVSAQYRF